MDALVLIPVVASVADSCEGARLESFAQESARRFRLRFERGDSRSALILSLDPERSWIGRPHGRWAGPSWSADPFAVACARALAGARVLAVERVGSDRVVRFSFSDGHALVAELGWHAGHLVLVDRQDRILGSTAGGAGPGGTRLAAGSPYRPPPIPPGKLALEGTSPADFDARIGALADPGEAPDATALRRAVLGVGRTLSEILVQEASAGGVSLGTILARRVARLAAGIDLPCIEGPADPFALAEEGRLDPRSIRLLAWESEAPPGGAARLRREEASATVGLYYEALERAERFRRRVEGLRGLLRQTRRRTHDAAQRARDDLVRFEDPERHRRLGEALLAGLTIARRVEDAVVVPDPYDPEREVVVPAPAGRALTSVADDLFARHRRGRRGLAGAAARLAALSARLDRLDRLDGRFEAIRGFESVEAIESAMREEGIAVGLERVTRASRPAARLAPVRAEGVRMFTSTDGMTILVGRGGRENDRLTFKLSGPEDFWLHAQGVPGAHVVIRNTEGRPRPPERALREAAAAAAWYSDARGHKHVDVQWTRRKYVRRAPRSPAGTVLLKRFETVRVSPSAPDRDGSPEDPS